MISRTTITLAAALLAGTLGVTDAQARGVGGGGGHIGGSGFGGHAISGLGESAIGPSELAMPPPPPVSSQRSFYEPQPGIQAPMTPVPPVAPLSQPPVQPIE
jgi:hypothetical protein